MSGCNNCQDKWRIVLAQQLKTENMKKNQQSSDEQRQEQDLQVENNMIEEMRSYSFSPEPVPVKGLQKPDVNKIIEERRKAIESGKIIKK